MRIKNEKLQKTGRVLVRTFQAAVFAAAVFGTVFVFRHPPSFLRVKEIVVMSPLKHLTEFDLIRLSEVKKGDNILTLRLQDVRERVLRYPWVKDVRLSKRFPARLFMWVEEKEPAALLDLAGEDGVTELFLVSGEGKVFKKLDAADPKDFPILTGLAAEEIPERLPRLMALVKSLETSELFNELGVSEARWDAREGLTLFTKEPCIQLTLGPEGGKLVWEERLQRFAQAWSTIQGGGRAPKVVDLSLDRRVVVRNEVKQD